MEAPGQDVERADEADREIRMSDFTLMAILPFREVAGRRATRSTSSPWQRSSSCASSDRARGGAKLPAASSSCSWRSSDFLLYSGIANDIDWTRRIGHLVIWRRPGLGGRDRPALHAFGRRGSGDRPHRCHRTRSGRYPVGDCYPGRLTGYLGDPNAGAFFIAVLGVLAIFFSDDRWKVRVVIAAPLVTGLVLCYSRTGLLAAAFALLWIVFGRRLGPAGGAAVRGRSRAGSSTTSRSPYVTFGPFSDRSGSDKLRERIIAQEHVQLADMPWYGHGPGSARVQIRDLEFFFHNSYLATRQEGGWGLCSSSSACWSSSSSDCRTSPGRATSRPLPPRPPSSASAAMAITLGEVLLDTPVAVALALALGQALPAAAAESPPDG